MPLCLEVMQQVTVLLRSFISPLLLELDLLRLRSDQGAESDCLSLTPCLAAFLAFLLAPTTDCPCDPSASAAVSVIVAGAAAFTAAVFSSSAGAGVVTAAALYLLLLFVQLPSLPLPTLVAHPTSPEWGLSVKVLAAFVPCTFLRVAST